MRTIYHVSADEIEAEGMFDLDGNLLGAWSLNDAHWRREYMNGFMEELEISIVESEDPKLVKKVMKYFGY